MMMFIIAFIILLVGNAAFAQSFAFTPPAVIHCYSITNSAPSTCLQTPVPPAVLHGIMFCPVCTALNPPLQSNIYPRHSDEYYKKTGGYHQNTSPVPGSTPAPCMFRTFVCSQKHIFNVVYVTTSDQMGVVPDHFEYNMPVSSSTTTKLLKFLKLK